MKKMIKKAMRPEKPFTKWAQENGIEQNHPERTRKSKFIIGLSSFAASIVVCLAIILPLTLSGTKGTELRLYLAQEAVVKEMAIDALYDNSDLLLFDFNQVIEYRQISYDVAQDNENLILRYTLDNLLIAASDGINAFYVDYKIRVYEKYEFFGLENYNNLPSKMTLNEMRISYGISLQPNLAYIRFSIGKTEYFMQVTGYEGITEITENTLTILLNDLLKQY